MEKDLHKPAFVDDKKIFWGQNWYKHMIITQTFSNNCNHEKLSYFILFYQDYISPGWDSTRRVLYFLLQLELLQFCMVLAQLTTLSSIQSRKKTIICIFLTWLLKSYLFLPNNCISVLFSELKYVAQAVTMQEIERCALNVKSGVPTINLRINLVLCQKQLISQTIMERWHFQL